MMCVIADFTTHGSPQIYGLPYPSIDSLDPMDLYYTLMFQDHSPKLPVYTYTLLLKKYLRVYVAFYLKLAYIWMCTKRQIFLEFSSYESKYLVSWNSICLENAHIRPSITSLEHYILSLLDTLKKEKLKSKETIVHCFLSFNYN